MRESINFNSSQEDLMINERAIEEIEESDDDLSDENFNVLNRQDALSEAAFFGTHGNIMALVEKNNGRIMGLSSEWGNLPREKDDEKKYTVVHLKIALTGRIDGFDSDLESHPRGYAIIKKSIEKYNKTLQERSEQKSKNQTN